MLEFLNLVDVNGNLSITNIGLIALLAKVVLASVISWPSIVALITALANYAHKRATNSNK